MFEGLLQPMHLLVIFGLAVLMFGPKEAAGAREGTRRGHTRLPIGHAG